MINFESVDKKYYQAEKEIFVLQNINFKLEESGIIAIVGKSGSGKSTFLSLLAGLDRPTSGNIYIDNSEITGMTEEEITDFRSKSIGIIFQNFHLVEHFTALENIMLPLEIHKISNARERALEVLALVGLADRGNHFPKQLSGGEKQRVAIARAYATSPKIILADEPSGNLDPETGETVMQTLFETAKELKQTVLIVTHDFELAKKCDHIYEIKNHQLVKL